MALVRGPVVSAAKQGRACHARMGKFLLTDHGTHRFRERADVACTAGGNDDVIETGRGEYTWTFDKTALADAQQGTSSKSASENTQRQIMDLPVSSIIRPLGKTRENDQGKVEALMHSIAEIGLQEPIDVLEVDGRYYGFSGCHRYEAHVKLGLEFIRCRVRKATASVLKMHLINCRALDEAVASSSAPHFVHRGFDMHINNYGLRGSAAVRVNRLMQCWQPERAFRGRNRLWSFQQEIVFLVGSAGSMLLPLLQTIKDFESHGYAHVLPLAQDEETCRKIARHVPEVGCAHSVLSLGISSDAASAAGQSAAKLDLFHTKWRTAARAVRAGFNVLLLDTDVLQLGDIYSYLKAEPYKAYTMLAQIRGSAAQYTTAHEVDPGVLYVQNADPSGATSWVLSEVADRLARWAEDGFQTLSAKGYSPCGLRSGEMLNDVLASAATGKLLFYGAVTKCQVQENPSLTQAMKQEVVWERIIKTMQASGSPELRAFGLTVPALPEFSEKLGGRLYPSSRGKVSSSIRESLAQACTKCTEWPDWPEIGDSPASNGIGPSTDRLALLPPWLAGSYEPDSKSQYWSSGQVLGHTQTPEGRTSPAAKAQLRMAYGAYHWDLVHKIKGKGAYYGSVDENHVPWVAAIHPDLLADPSLKEAQFVEILESLVQVAQYMNKLVVWPAVPCSLSWVTGPEWAKFPGPDANRTMLCMKAAHLEPECLAQGLAVIPWELEHLKDVYRLHFPMDASPEKTLVAEGRANPDYMQALKYMPLVEMPFNHLAKQIVENVVMLPGAKEPTRVHGQRLHVVYVGQAIKILYDESHPGSKDDVPHFDFKGDRDVWQRSVPQRSAAQLEASFKDLQRNCLGHVIQV